MVVYMCYIWLEIELGSNSGRL